MSEHNITVQGGHTVRLPTAGKYCDRDILVHAEVGGVELPALTNEGAASDLMKGKQMISGAGNAVTGTFTLDGEISEQDSIIEQIKSALKGKASGVNEYYDGNYEVTPKVTEQTLLTAQKIMKQDVRIKEIPYFEVGNLSGGNTVYIGNEV